MGIELKTHIVELEIIEVDFLDLISLCKYERRIISAKDEEQLKTILNAFYGVSLNKTKSIKEVK